MKILNIGSVLLAVLVTSTALAAANNEKINNKIKVAVEYQHGSINVHYTLPCVHKTTCSLKSLEGAEPSWMIEVIPTLGANGLVTIETTVTEGSAKVSQSKVINKLGETSEIVSSGTDSPASKLKVRAF